jgi:hypothetical protein
MQSKTSLPTTAPTTNFTPDNDLEIGSDAYMEKLGARPLTAKESAAYAKFFPARLSLPKRILRFVGIRC